MATTFSVGELSWLAYVDAKHAARHHDSPCIKRYILNGSKHRLSASSSVFPRQPAKLRPPSLIDCHALGLLFPNCHQRKFTFNQNPKPSWEMIGRPLFDLTLNRSLPIIFSLGIPSAITPVNTSTSVPHQRCQPGLAIDRQNLSVM